MDTSKRGALEDIRAARELAEERTEPVIRQSREIVTAAVKAARARGATWQEIADHLGVTRQAAWERFGK